QALLFPGRDVGVQFAEVAIRGAADAAQLSIGGQACLIAKSVTRLHVDQQGAFAVLVAGVFAQNRFDPADAIHLSIQNLQQRIAHAAGLVLAVDLSDDDLAGAWDAVDGEYRADLVVSFRVTPEYSCTVGIRFPEFTAGEFRTFGRGA